MSKLFQNNGDHKITNSQLWKRTNSYIPCLQLDEANKIPSEIVYHLNKKDTRGISIPIAAINALWPDVCSVLLHITNDYDDLMFVLGGIHINQRTCLEKLID